jgi:hypothetical protein
MKPW